MKKVREHDSFLRELYRSSIEEMSYVGLLWVTFTFLLLGCYGKPTDRICWFLKRTRTEAVWRGHCPICKRRFKLLGLYSALDERKPWSKEYCSSPFLEHSTQLCKRSIPKRFYYLFNRLGANTPNYRPGIRWCYKCATIADNALSKESDYIPPKVSVQMFILFLVLFLSKKVNLIY